MLHNRLHFSLLHVYTNSCVGVCIFEVLVKSGKIFDSGCDAVPVNNVAALKVYAYMFVGKLSQGRDNVPCNLKMFLKIYL